MKRQIMDLSSNLWRMEKMRPGQGVLENLPQIPAERDGLFGGWNDGTVPGDVYTDLTIAGEIEDPYIGRNLAKAKWVQEYEWWYVLRFNADKEFAKRKLTLLFEGVDYACDVWFNHKYLGHHEGMMSPFAFDITGKLNSDVPVTEASECDNMLFVKIEPAPKNIFNIAGFRHVFCGDYLPGFVTVGIWRPVKIIATDIVKINDYRMDSYISNVNNQSGDAKISYSLDVTSYEEKKCEYDINISLKNEDKVYNKKVKTLLKPGENAVQLEMLLKDVLLWWSWDLGNPNLYDLSIELWKENEIIDNLEDKVGIREITMKKNPGFTDEESAIPWTFVLNGKEMYLRSACWGGQPSMLYGRNSYDKYKDFLTKAKKCNMNNLRIFGWHPPETKEFYDICDELGITVWTNFMFSSQVLREDQEYIDSVIDECEIIVKERRNHPSNIYWMGGEEVYFSKGQLESKNKEIMQLVGKRVNEITNIPYGDASPLSNQWGVALGYKPCESRHLNSHYYAAGAITMEDAFKDPNCCIVPELTAASAPCVESLKKCIPEEDLWPIGPSWGFLQANVGILKSINIEVFGDEKFNILEEFVNATQIAQGEVFKFAIEALRRLKPKVSGVSICHFITNRPLIKWEIVDYYGKEKLSYDYVKTAYSPLLATMEYKKRRNMPNDVFTGKCFVVNDLDKEYKNVEYVYVIRNNKKQIVACEKKVVNINAFSCENKFEFEYTVQGEIGDKFYIDLSLIDENRNVLSSNYYTLLIDDENISRKRCLEAYKKHRTNRLKWGHSLYTDMKEDMILE